MEDRTEQLQPGGLDRSRMHQAVGMVVAQLGLDPVSAAQVLADYAADHRLSVDAAARAVVDREIAFGSDNP